MKYMLKISDNTYLNLDLDSYEDPMLLNVVTDTILNAKVYKKYSETFTKADNILSPNIELLIVPDSRLASKENEEEEEGE